MGDRSHLDFKEPRFFLVAMTILIAAVILFYFIASMVTSVGYQTFANAGVESVPTSCSVTIILDAGHGGEDPGAIANGNIEKVLNLSVAQKLEELLRMSGLTVIMTRTEDRLLYNDGEEDRKKYYDLYNRAQIAATIPNAIFVSIHMNKFPLENCFGLQTFYSSNHPQSQLIATTIQEASKLLITNNKRIAKQDENTIFLLKHLQIPAVLIECGFLSNPGEARLLSTEEYREDLAFTIYCGIIQFLQEHNIENELYLQ
jgi:N-acetylmuramoyl-L-alanine amidase